MKAGTASLSEGPQHLMLMNFGGEFEALPLGAPRSPRIRKSPHGPSTPGEEEIEGKRTQACTHSLKWKHSVPHRGEKEGGIPKTPLQGSGTRPRSSCFLRSFPGEPS